MRGRVPDRLGALTVLIAEAEHHQRVQAEFVEELEADGRDAVSPKELLVSLDETLEGMRDRLTYLREGGLDQ